jgi:acylphosphatase
VGATSQATDAARITVGVAARAGRSPDDVVELAGELGLLGWVREGEAGELLIHAEGGADAVAALAERLGVDGDPESALERVKVEGHEQFAIRGVPAGPFRVLRRVGRSGFELQLEVAGELRAWALPKGPSMDPADKRMAFEAKPGEPAEGELEVWDSGAYEQGGRVPWPEAIERGHAVFVLHGERLEGGFALQRTSASPRAKWLLIKRRDDHARPGSDVVAESDPG